MSAKVGYIYDNSKKKGLFSTDTVFSSLTSLHFQYILFDEITLQRIDIYLESMPSLFGNAADGARALALEGLFYLDVACCRQFVNLHTQVACRCSRLLLDIGELGFVGTDKQRHDGQSQLSVQQWV